MMGTPYSFSSLQNLGMGTGTTLQMGYVKGSYQAAIIRMPLSNP